MIMALDRQSCIKWFFAPVFFVVFVCALLIAWAVMEPSHLIQSFDSNGRSVFELATLPFFAAIIPLVWWKCPFEGARMRKMLLSLMVSVVVVMALVKQLDLHNAALSAVYPAYVGTDGNLLPGLVKPNGSPLSGVPFKMRVITNSAVPFGMRFLIVLYFTLFFGVFSFGFAYLFPAWLKGVLKLDPAAWSFGCLGASGVMVQIFDRLPAWVRHSTGQAMLSSDGSASAMRSLCTAFEEGGEMMIAVFAIMTIVLSNKAISQRSESEK